MKRRTVLKMLAAAWPALKTGLTQAESRLDEKPLEKIEPGRFAGTRALLEAYEAPQWFRDAKFGIWAHWGPQSAAEAGDWYARNMYIQGERQYNTTWNGMAIRQNSDSRILF